MQSPKICFQFQRGFCSYGSNCRFFHQQAGSYVQHDTGIRYGRVEWTQSPGRGGRELGQYNYYQGSYVQVSSSAWTSAPRPAPSREWSSPLRTTDPEAQQIPSFKFRFMSWNILANELANSHAAELYPQAHHTCLDWPRRLAAVVRHVAAHMPDVLCLQEVDDWQGLRKALGTLGYDGVHVQRTGGRGDGCATLWLRARLRLAGSSGSVGGSATAPYSEKSASGSRSSSGGGGCSSGVHQIHMKDYGLKDNVALLVHLLPRLGVTAVEDNELSERECTVTAAGFGNDEDTKEDSSSAGGDGNEDIVDGAPQSVERRTGQSRRRPKRTRQNSDGNVTVGAAATAAITSLQPYPVHSAARLQPTASAPAQPRTQSSQMHRNEINTCPKTDASCRSSTLDNAVVPNQRRVSCSDGSGSCPLPHHLLQQGFWVANTHILFNIKRGDIKLGQLRVILSELAARAAAVTDAPLTDTPTPRAALAGVPVLFAGDFNAAPGSGLYRYLRYGELRLAVEDRRELSGQIEGYGYTQLQRDAMAGRPSQLARWAPCPELRNHQAPNPTAAAMAVGTAAVASVGNQTSTVYSNPSCTAGSSDGSRHARQQQQAWQTPAWQPQEQQRQDFTFRSLKAHWVEEELVHAMGRAAVTQAAAVVRGAATVSGNGDCKGNTAAGDGAGGLRASEALLGSQSHLSGIGQRFGLGSPASSGASANAPVAAVGGWGSNSGRDGTGRSWREQAAAAAAQWREVTKGAVVQNPLQLRSAYAAVDKLEREPVFTTLHARYVGTVDFIWYTPGEEEVASRGSGIAGSSGSASTQRVKPSSSASASGMVHGNQGAAGVEKGRSADNGGREGGRVGQGGSAGFKMTPVRVLQPPDPLSYPNGMPCRDWPSDHVSLVVDFELS